MDAPIRGAGNFSPNPHTQPRFADIRALGDVAEIAPFKLGAEGIKAVHINRIAQNSAGCKRQHSAAIPRHSEGVFNPNYRQIVAKNLAILLAARALSPATVKAYYLEGPRKGKRVSERMIRYILALPRPRGTPPPSPALDVLAAIAEVLSVPVHLLLLPGLDPVRPPVIWSEEQAREAQQIARAYARLLGQRGETDYGLDPDHQEGATAHPPAHRPVPSTGPQGKRKAAKRRS